MSWIATRAFILFGECSQCTHPHQARLAWSKPKDFSYTQIVGTSKIIHIDVCGPSVHEGKRYTDIDGNFRNWRVSDLRLSSFTMSTDFPVASEPGRCERAYSFLLP